MDCETNVKWDVMLMNSHQMSSSNLAVSVMLLGFQAECKQALMADYQLLWLSPSLGGQAPSAFNNYSLGSYILPTYLL